MLRRVIPGLVVLAFLLTGCAAPSYFGVPTKSVSVPADFEETEAAIQHAERSPGAKYCPDKLARAKDLAKQGVERYWACFTVEGLDKLAQARKLAKEAESCQPPAPAPQPQPVPPPPPAKKEISFKEIHFNFDHTNIIPSNRAILDEDVAILKANPGVKVEIAGHTDGKGTASYNLLLSERRAAQVLDYLCSSGLDRARFKVVGYGKSRPIASNDTEEGRAKNRRVELNVMK